MVIWLLLACGRDKGERDDSEPWLEVSEVAEVVSGLGFVSDATPSPDARTVYYLASGPWSVWSAPFEGEGASAQLAELSAPRNVVVDPSGETLYISDGDGILSLPSAGGEPTLFTESGGTSPEGLHVQDGWIWFTGLSPSGSGAIGLHRLEVESGAVETVAEGSPFYSPEGVVVEEGGEVAWVCDSAAGADSTGALIRVEGGEGRRVLDGFEAGNPCGVALGEGALLLSSLASGKSQLLLYDVASGETGTYSAGIGENVGSGGMHAAHDAPGIYAWTGLKPGGEGVVHRVEVE